MKEVEVVSDNRVSSQLALLGEEEERSRWISKTLTLAGEVTGARR
jgi:hypothetical protein